MNLVQFSTNPLFLLTLFVYSLVITKLVVNYYKEIENPTNADYKLSQGGFIEVAVIVAIISLVAWTMKESSKKNQIKSAEKYLASQNYSKAVEIFLNVKDWERAAETIVNAPQGTQIILLRKLQGVLSQSALKNVFLKIGDKYRNTHYAVLSAIAYQLADMPWRAAQAYISVGNVQLALETINNSQVFSNDRPRAIRNLAKFAYDTNHPLESARLLQSIGAEDEATAVLIASGREPNILETKSDSNLDYNEITIQKPPTVDIKKKRDLSYSREAKISPFIMLQQEIKQSKDFLQVGNVNGAQDLINRSKTLIEKIPSGESKESMELKREFKKVEEAIKRLIEARNAFKSQKTEESQILYSELIDFAGDLFSAEIYAEAGLAYENQPSDPEIVHEYFLEASNRATSEKAKKNYKSRANKALRLLQTDLPETEIDEFDESNQNLGKVFTTKTDESCCVCRRVIGESTVIQCTHCKSIAHYPHMAEWLKIKGVCPVCKQKLSIPDLKKELKA